jgi:hypothetical protein
MSRLYFETRDDTAEVKGWEKAWLGGLVDDVAFGVMSLTDSSRVDRMQKLINPDHYMAQYNDHPTNNGPLQWAHMFHTAARADWTGDSTAPARTPLLMWRGRPFSAHGLLMNTALAVGNDAVKLAARLNAQCEIHAWIAEEDRIWVARMIEEALRTGIFRRSLRREPVAGEPVPYRNGDLSGWKEVIELLRSGSYGPVVTSYSITDEFPNAAVAGYAPDTWEDLTRTEKWDASMHGLQGGLWSQDFTGLRIWPKDWSTFRFHHNLTAFDLFADDYAARLDREFKISPRARL